MPDQPTPDDPLNRPVPATLVHIDATSTEPTEQRRFEEWARVFESAQLADLGESNAWSVAELRVALTNPDKDFVSIAALDPAGVVVGAAELIMSLRDNTHLGIFNLAVRPERRRRGIGTLLLAEVEQVARERGRRTVISETEWSGPDPDGDLRGPFASGLGYEDVQTMRRSDLAVAEAAPPLPAPAGYAVETHVGIPPEVDAQDRAWLNRRMSTDAPLGGLDMEEQDWDVDRVHALDARIEAMGRQRVSAFARHLESGQLVGFTEIQISPATPERGYQDDTLVLTEHRGHGLGLALKATNLAALRTAYPEVGTVRTWNAVENTHMLAVNEALGFRTVGFEREWQKRLGTAADRD